MYRPSITSIAAVALVALTLTACGKDDDEGPGREAKKTTTTAKPAVTAPARTTTTAQPQKTATGCEVVEQPEPKADGARSRPSLRLDRKRIYTAVMRTSCGTVDIRLDVADSPKTSASFVSLARDGFFDRLTFHRVARPAGTPFVVQAGDPTGSGNGGAGYDVIEAPPAGTRYVRGTVAMAKGEIDDAGTSSSQFFIVTAPDAGLPSDYAVLGRVVDGLEAVDRIGDVPTDPTTEIPTEPVVIKSVKITDRKKR